MKAVNIQWDFDESEEVDLPNEIELPGSLIDDDEISDYISDVTGFCHNGFEISDEKDDGEEDDDFVDDYDYCYECGGYGDDYYFDDDGEMQCRCQECPFNPDRPDDWDD